MIDEDSSKFEGMSGSAHSSDEQKQVDKDSDNNSSIPSNSNLFSIIKEDVFYLEVQLLPKIQLCYTYISMKAAIRF